MPTTIQHLLHARPPFIGERQHTPWGFEQGNGACWGVGADLTRDSTYISSNRAHTCRTSNDAVNRSPSVFHFFIGALPTATARLYSANIYNLVISPTHLIPLLLGHGYMCDCGDSLYFSSEQTSYLNKITYVFVVWTARYTVQHYLQYMYIQNLAYLLYTLCYGTRTSTS